MSEQETPASGALQALDPKNQVANDTGDRSVADSVHALEERARVLRIERADLKAKLASKVCDLFKVQTELTKLRAQIPKRPVGRPQVRTEFIGPKRRPGRPRVSPEQETVVRPIGRPPLIAKKLIRLRSLIEAKEKAIRMSLRDFPDGNPVMEEMKVELASLIAEEDRLLSLKAAGQVQAW